MRTEFLKLSSPLATITYTWLGVSISNCGVRLFPSHVDGCQESQFCIVLGFYTSPRFHPAPCKHFIISDGKLMIRSGHYTKSDVTG